jgi:hypothetical protein
LPIPDEAPVMTIVLPSRRLAAAEADMALLVRWRLDRDKGRENERKIARERGCFGDASWAMV